MAGRPAREPDDRALYRPGPRGRPDGDGGRAAAGRGRGHRARGERQDARPLPARVPRRLRRPLRRARRRRPRPCRGGAQRGPCARGPRRPGRDRARRRGRQRSHGAAVSRDADVDRRMIEQVRDYAIFRIGVGGKAESWNEGVLNVLGFERAEFVGLDVARLFVPEDRAAGIPERELAQAAATGSASDDRWMLRKDGRRIWVGGRTSSIRDATGQLAGYTKVMRDRTDLKRVDTSLRAAADRYQVLVETASDAIITVAPDGAILFANPAIERVFGYAPAELAGRHLSMLIPEPLEPRADDSQRIEVCGRHKSGREVRLELALGQSPDGAEHTYTGIVRDVTERWEAARALAESEARARALIEQSPLPTLVFDTAGHPVGANPAWERKWGVTLADARQGYTLLADAQLAAQGHMPLVERALGGEAVTLPPINYDISRETGGRGSAFWVQGHFYPVRNSTGEVTEIVLVQIDITERVRAEHQLRQAERMQAIGTLAGGVAHEVNNQMTAVLGFGQFVLDALGPGHPQAGDVTDMLESARRAAQITQQLLAFSRRQVTQPEVLDLSVLVGGLRSVLTRILGTDRTLLVAEPETRLTVRADRTQIEQVLINLVANASDALAGGGTVGISIDDVELDADYGRERGVHVVPGRYVRLVVSDDGTGMDRVTLERIFEPFFTTKPVGAGTGLGLSTVYGIVKQHDGFIWAYSEPFIGTTMKIYLPAALQEAGSGTETAAEVGSPRTPELEHATVLVVEDEPAVRNLVRRSLEAVGLVVVEARNGREALEMFAGRAERPRLVLTDVIMPELNGRELSEALASSEPGLPVLFMSGYTGEDVL